MRYMLYWDYINGMADLRNPNTIRLYTGFNGQTEDQMKLIASAPYYEDYNFSISNKYSESAGSLMARMVKGFLTGTQSAASMVGGIMEIGADVTSMVSRFSPNAGAAMSKFTSSDLYKKAMSANLSYSKMDMELPYEKALVFTSANNTIKVPPLKMTLISSKNLANWLTSHTDISTYTAIKSNEIKNEKDETPGTIQSCISNGTTYIKIVKRGSWRNRLEQKIKDTYGTDNVEIDKPLPPGEDITEITIPYEKNEREEKPLIKEGDVTKTPVRSYINYLRSRLGGRVTDSKHGFRVFFEAPENKNPYLFNPLNIRIDNVESDWFTMVLGDRDRPIIIPNLAPVKFEATMSKELTPNGDFLWADIDIEFNYAKKVSTKILDNYILK